MGFIISLILFSFGGLEMKYTSFIEWISVDEEFPPLGTPLLLATPGVVHCGYAHKITPDGKIVYADCSRWLMYDVRFWSLLPPMPKSN